VPRTGQTLAGANSERDRRFTRVCGASAELGGKPRRGTRNPWKKRVSASSSNVAPELESTRGFKTLKVSTLASTETSSTALAACNAKKGSEAVNGALRSAGDVKQLCVGGILRRVCAYRETRRFQKGMGGRPLMTGRDWKLGSDSDVGRTSGARGQRYEPCPAELQDASRTGAEPSRR
jgi:hypothetical protein